VINTAILEDLVSLIAPSTRSWHARCSARLAIDWNSARWAGPVHFRLAPRIMALANGRCRDRFGV